MTPLILSLLFVVIVAFSALMGFVRGFSKTIIRLITFVLAIVLTFAFSGTVTSLVCENVKINGLTIGENILAALTNNNEMLAGIIESAPLLEEAIIVLPEFLIGIVMFIAMFLVLNLISWVLYLIFGKTIVNVLFNGGSGSIGQRFAGLGIGVVTGVLAFAMLMAPMFGFFSVLPEKSALDQVVNTLEEQKVVDAPTAEIIKGELTVLESPVYTVSTALGVTPMGKSYLKSVSKIECEGEVTYLTDEFTSLFAVVETAIEGELLTAIKNSANDQKALYVALSNEAFMQELISDMFNSKLLRAAIPEVTAIAIEATARMLGVPENKQAVYDNMMSDIADIIKESDVDFDAIHAYEEANNVTYADVMYADEQNTLMTEEEYKKEIEKLNKLEDKIAKVVDKSVAGGSKAVATGIAKGFVKGVKEQARVNGAASLKEFVPEAVQQNMAAINAADIYVEGESADAIASMLGKIQNPETFETDLATIETVAISIRECITEAVKDDNKTTETANTLACVVSNFAGAVSSATDANGKIDPLKLDFEKVGNAVSALQGSTLNDVGSTVLDIVVSGDLGDNDMISSAVGGIKKAYNEGKPVSETVKSAGDAIKLVDAMNKADGEKTEDFETAFKNLVEGLTETTMGILPDILKKDVLVSFGIPEEHTSASYDVIETLLNELMKLQGTDNYDNEVNAVLALYDFATGDMSNVKEEDIPKLTGYAIDSTAIYNTLNSVSTSNPFGIKVENEGDRNTIAEYLDKYYAIDMEEEADKQRVYNVYAAIARVIGVENNVSYMK
ncbi:MAG: CvpA family protein [Clostridia bacterium]|nr:CvpA family protein [Clostridia bacterium]